MSNAFRNLVTAAGTVALLMGGPAVAAEEPSAEKDLSSFQCKDVMRLSGSERENSLAFVHGYRLGKMNTTRYDIDALADLTERFIDFCLENPNEKALAAFERLGK
jgi:hypothetical protein